MNPKWVGQGLITACDFWKGGNRVTYLRRVLVSDIASFWYCTYILHIFGMV